MTTITQTLAKELSINTAQVEATIALLDEGATVPFIARYRKDKTKGLDDAQLRELEKRLVYLRDMHKRREKILELLEQQGKLTDDLKARIEAADSKLQLEDIYLPYRPRRTSKAQKARDAGLTDLAAKILAEDIMPTAALEGFEPQGELAENYKEQPAQLEAMQYIIMETWSEDLALLDSVRESFAKVCQIKSQVANEQKREVGEKFKDYFDHTENLAKLPAHRLLAMLRGRQENVLTLKVVLPEQAENPAQADQPFIDKIIKNFALEDTNPTERCDYLKDTAKKLWLEKYRPHIEHRLLTEKRLVAEADAIDVFGENLRNLLMAAPAGGKVTLGVDPGIRHGVKMAVIDATGKVLENGVATVYPFDSGSKKTTAKDTIKALIQDHNVEIVAIGNGTASRETEVLISELKKEANLDTTIVIVNEAGASVYSASELASQELSELDVSIRGAVSIARRLQDPLSELVKVDPKAIGVGQYQHDVNQNNLSDKLDVVTQDCVNAVGVDVNTASPAILTHIAGLNSNVAQQIFSYRNEHGAFNSREDLKKVPRLGERTFEQAAGFLRIRDAENKLETTGVHPESYALVEQILAKAEKSLADVLGKKEALAGIDPDDFATEAQGVEAVRAVLAELEKPAHDPRPEFKMAQFMDDVNEISDLHEGMELEGVITNVTHFGAFVDVGVHQDGLVHISELANGFVADPLNHVKVGQIVKVRVLQADAERKRISFSMRTEKSASKPNKQPRFEGKAKENNRPKQGQDKKPNRNNAKGGQRKQKQDNTPKVGSLGALLAEAGLKKSGK